MEWRTNMGASVAVKEEGPNHDRHPREIFEQGTLIEVATVEEGFSGSWYVATVIKPPSPPSPKKREAMTSPSSSNKYYVEYVALVDDEGEVSPLKEFVDAELVRPVPPPLHSSFRVNDVIDAFYHDGWWTGVITAVLPEYRFMVAFQRPPDLIEFGFSDLRVHLDWIGGKWVKPEPTKEHSQSGSPENSSRKRRGRPPGLVRPSSGKLKIPLSKKDKPAALSKQLEKPSPTKGGQMSANSSPKSPSDSTADDSSGASMGKRGEGAIVPAYYRRVSPKKLVKDSSSKEGNGNDMEIEVHAIAIDSAPGIGLLGQTLPFEKTVPLWEAIESMEVFQSMPQKPHFHPLEWANEDCREGLAIGYMLLFSRVVKKIAGFRADQPRSSMEKCLENLVVLEENGFDVKPIRDRLNSLLLKKDKQEILQNELIEVEGRIADYEKEKENIGEEMEEIDKQIKELQEKREAAMGNVETKNAEIAGSQSILNCVSDRMREIEMDFEDIAATPW